MVVHYAFGASGGPAAAFLQRRGLGPLAAGLSVGTGMWAVVDEGANAVLGLTPSAPEWPLVTHVRALGAHLVYGIVLGGLLTAATRSSKNNLGLTIQPVNRIIR